MATTLYVKAIEHRLVPVSQHDWELLDGVRQDVDMEARLTIPRSRQQHKWYWALLGKVAKGCGLTSELLHGQLKYRAGLFDLQLIEHAPVIFIRSTSETAMDGAQFTKYLDFAVLTLLTEYIPDVKRADLIREIDAMTNLSYDKIRHAPQAQAAVA